MLTNIAQYATSNPPRPDAPRWGVRASWATLDAILELEAEAWTRWQAWGSTKGFNGHPFPVPNDLHTDGTGRDGYPVRFLLAGRA